MKQLTALFFLTLLVSCSNNAGENAAPTDSTDAGSGTWKESELETEEAPADKAQFYVWEVDTDVKTMRKNPVINPSFYSVDMLIMGLNERYPQVQLEKKRLSHDTLYTEIKNAAFLTEQMGSAGSEQYIAQAVLNLTAVKGINHVRIDFEEGSHASPDVWSRKAFEGFKEVQ
jgi:PKD repeat protein